MTNFPSKKVKSARKLNGNLCRFLIVKSNYRICIQLKFQREEERRNCSNGECKLHGALIRLRSMFRARKLSWKLMRKRRENSLNNFKNFYGLSLSLRDVEGVNIVVMGLIKCF